MAKTAQTTILLIEDSLSDARLIKELLHSTSQDSFHVITASTLSQGLTLLSSNSIDVILLDLGLPDSQGVDTFRAINEHASHLPIIILTVSDDEALGQQAVHEGAQRFLSKDALTLGAPYAGIFTRMIRFTIEQKRTEAALAESEREYRNLVHNLNALVLRVDPQQRITFANDYALSLLGYAPEEFVGHHVVGTLLPPTESTGRDLEQMANDVLTRPERYEHNRNEVITKGGRRLWIEWTNTPQYDEDGVYTGVLATGIDVTEQIKTEDALSLERHRSQRYLDLIDLAQDAIVVRDLDHRAITWNKGAERLFGWTAEQAIGKRVPDLIHVVFPIPFKEVHATLLKEGHWEGTVACSARDGTSLIVEHRFTLTRDKTGKLARILSISYDVTAQRQAEEALQHAHEEVQILNEELHSKNEELRTANDELEYRVQERTEQLASMNEELQSTNEELRHETEQRTRAEKAARVHAQRTAILNEIIHVVNEAQDLPTLYDQALAFTADRLGFDFAVIATEAASGHLRVQHAYNLSPEVVQALNKIRIDEYPYTRTVYREGELIVCDEAPLDTLIARSGTRGASAGIPFYSEGGVVGHIALMAERPRSFTAEDRRLFTAIGEEFGTAVARLTTKQHAEQRATMLDGARDAIVMWDVNELITYWNHGAERLYGWTREEALGKYIHSLLKTTFAQPLERIKSTLTEAGRWEGELTHTTRTGTTVTVESHMTLERAPGGTPIATLEINNDVTEQQRAEEQVRAAARYTRSLIEVSLDPLVTINAEGVITDVNTATEEVTGYSRDELIGSDFSDYFTEPEKARAGYKQVFTDSLVRDYPLAIRHKSGRLTDVLYNASVYRDEAGEVLGVFAAARDVTERKRAEEELQRYSECLEELVEERTGQLKDAERLAGIGETAAMIGHDLRNPLQGLQYIVDLQRLRFERMSSRKRDAEDWQKERALFDRISEQIYYMDKIVGDLQDYARPMEPEYETVALDALINDVLNALPHPDSVQVTVDTNNLDFTADPHLMRRVFANLILNAVQAMPNGGVLTISAAADDGSVAIHVTDTGVGIPADMRDKVFSPLTTGKAKGTGLGLAVVKRIVDAHGGTIEFESEEGTGTAFTVTLPQTVG
ncbi:MAG: PAS domain S-box protein [Halobacteriota archaeon]